MEDDPVLTFLASWLLRILLLGLWLLLLLDSAAFLLGFGWSPAAQGSYLGHGVWGRVYPHLVSMLSLDRVEHSVMCLWALFWLFGSILVFGGRTVVSLLYRGTELARGADSCGLASLTPASCFFGWRSAWSGCGQPGPGGGWGSKDWFDPVLPGPGLVQFFLPWAVIGRSSVSWLLVGRLVSFSSWFPPSGGWMVC